MSETIRFFVCAEPTSQDTPLGQTAELHVGRVRRLCRLPAGGPAGRLLRRVWSNIGSISLECRDYPLTAPLMLST